MILPNVSLHQVITEYLIFNVSILISFDVLFVIMIAKNWDISESLKVFLDMLLHMFGNKD